MRVDKFIWCVRFFKTRSLAGEQVRGGKVLLSGLPVKSSRDIKSGDSITIKRHGFDQVYEVLSIPKARIGAKLVEDYVVNRTPQEELDKEEFLKLARNITRQKGLGRPTKKDRRDIEGFSDNE
ncbi:MAG: S4 domain-containing protein [Flavobacteriales bacterium]|jgi:ribosome-associated heat shock protein Hsp15|tara:strand:+ start:158 stop:526 length:369 start_codon:yes stop_codon:yes gene_type:complete